MNSIRHTLVHRARLRRHSGVLSSVLVLFFPVFSAPALCGELPRTNLAIYQALARDLAVKMGGEIPSADTAAVDLVVRPTERAWIVEGALTEGLRSTGKRVVMHDGEITADCLVSTMSVLYEEGRRSSLFGERLVDRVVDLRIRALIADRKTGQVYSSAEYGSSERDTIPVSAIPRLEDASIPVTHGDIPSQGFFTWFAEPLVMISAVAISILLLFHVRS